MVDGHGWGGIGFFGPGMLLFWALIIVVVVLLVRWRVGASSGSPRDTGAKTPLDIVRERYAKGEIDKEEFEQTKRDLGAS